jgi:hypothetical protein
VAFALGIGLAPGPLLDRSAASVDALIENYRGRLAEARANPQAPARMVGHETGRRPAPFPGRPRGPGGMR